MPFFANTPEALLGRTDSKNPSITCRGITGSGRPCRRTIASAKLPAVARFQNTTLRVDDPRDETLYCYQHKEQASASAHSSPGPRMSNTPILELDERTSMDTLADRLGLEAEKAKRQKQQQRPDGTDSGKQKPSQSSRPTKMTRPKPNKTVEFCCCFRIPIEEVSPPPRPKPRPVQTQTPMTASAPAGYQSNANGRIPPLRTPRPSLSGQTPPQSSTSQTARYLSLIPAHTSPETASRLMAELAKPISRQDEPGYIYMFWLTPDSQPSKPPADAARSLLAPSTPTRPGGSRRPSDVMAAFASMSLDDSSTRGGPSSRCGNKNPDKKKVLLKIGRATNVQRRLNEWTRQCGYDLSLIRYYPYIPSASPAAVPRKMPHSHKVERLIHIELAGLGLRIADGEKCAACGREHREWFQVEATRRGVADVDEVIRRWVEWNESQE